MLAVSFVAYVFLFSNFTVRVNEDKKIYIVGYACTPAALKIPRYRDACPWLGSDELAGVPAQDVTKLWTRFSVSVNRTVIVSIWLVFFSCLAAMLGKFLAYQMRVTRGERTAKQPEADSKR